MAGVLLDLQIRATGKNNLIFSKKNINFLGFFSSETKTLVQSATVPVPIYCRPLGGEDIGMKIWCSTAVDLTGGEAGFPDLNNGKFNLIYVTKIKN